MVRFLSKDSGKNLILHWLYVFVITVYHMTCIDNMCRICADRVQKQKDILGKVNPKHASEYSHKMYILFGVDMANDSVKYVRIRSVVSANAVS